ncbi:DNA ligase [Candidatus Micrarchaeota archaeon CG11_big_fil_rev_8_21_14_0_20_47_5]|nr:MAG: hypothetical protein AUJ17_00245 [Candidatus Micrarchaeota archaeon CG1_02_47_40]PIN83848.1 MAG: DNA ligase [Candidatus Micrarchaeota archaeon CG11_big_fil_rev_8_21_14_0_20_47_5]
MRFSILAHAFSQLEETSLRLKMTDILAELFTTTSPAIADKVVYLLQGAIAPPYEGIDIGIGEKFAIEAISVSCGYSRKEVESLYKKEGDLGAVAEMLISKKRQSSLYSQPLMVEKVFDSFMKLAKLSGTGSQDAKIKALAELLNYAAPLEARYIIRFPLGKLRLGVGDPTILDALSVYAQGDKGMREEIERAYNLCSDLGFVAKSFLEDKESIKHFKITPFKPIRPALAERLSTSEEIMEKIGKCAIDAKYDGLRMQVHKKGEEVEIYSRKLEKMTHMFPEIVEAVRKLKQDELIFEGEALAYSEREKKYYSFQTTIQRKRKYGIGKMSEDFPLRLFVFDILQAQGKDYTQTPYAERRKALEKIFSKNSTLPPSEQILAENTDEVEKFFQKCIQEGLEGIIAKDLTSPYIAGARKFAWIKLKKSYGQMADSIDVVIVGYYLGKGHRADFKFGGLLAAVYNEETEKFETIARIGSGFTEEEMQTFQKMLKPLIVKEKPKELSSKITPDFWCEPKYVITVSADEISHSPMHTCGYTDERGYALRFPRMVQIRGDKGIYDVTTTEEIKKLFEMQRKGKGTDGL